MSKYEIYRQALVKFGEQAQMIVAIEELSECQKELCKILRGGQDYEHLAEEVADAQIMLEQVQMIFPIREQVDDYTEQKLQRLYDRTQL